MLPAAGKVHVPLLGAHSGQTPLFAAASNIPVTGSVEISIGAFGDGKNAPKVTPVVSLAQDSVAGAAGLSVHPGSAPNKVLVKVWQADGVTASVVATTINLIAYIGPTVGR